MRTFPLVAGLLAAVCWADAAPVVCAGGTLADYYALPADGCSIGGSVVRDFLPESPSAGTVALPPEAVAVTPVTGPGGAGLQFALNAAAQGSGVELAFAFNLAGGPYGTMSLTLGGSAVTPDGANTGTADVCVGAELAGGVCNGAVDTLAAFDLGFDAQLTGTVDLRGVNAAGVRTSIVVDPGVSGTAALGTATIQVQEVPEPSTAAMAAAGLLGAGILAMLRRLRR